MILACDPSTTRFGIAFGGPADGKPKAFTVKLPGADEHVFDRTLGNAADTVALYCRTQQVKIVAIEAPIIAYGPNADRTAHTMASLMQLTGAVRAAAQRSGCSVLMAASSTVRKMFVGHGRPEDPKRAVMARCKLLGWQFEDDNSADAAATWAWAMSVNYPQWAPNATPLFARGVA